MFQNQGVSSYRGAASSCLVLRRLALSRFFGDLQSIIIFNGYENPFNTLHLYGIPQEHCAVELVAAFLLTVISMYGVWECFSFGHTRQSKRRQDNVMRRVASARQDKKAVTGF